MSKVPIDLPAPGFSLPDYRGEEFNLEDLLGVKNVLLVFNRGFR